MGPPRRSRQTIDQGLQFVDYNPTKPDAHNDKSTAEKRRIRAQAARASSNLRLETIRKRNEGRTWQLGLLGKEDASGSVAAQDPLPCRAVEQHQNTVTRYRKREASAAVHSDTVLGGSIPVDQVNIAVLANFLNRFQTGAATERPWIELVMGEANSSAIPSLSSKALQANATALCANDLREHEVSRLATKLYLSTISRLQAALRSPNWHDPMVMYTSMILTLFECIQSSDPAAQTAHVSGVAQLIQQRGPHRFVHGLEHQTFRYYRINILLMSLAERQPSFLAETPWKTIPFSGECPPKTFVDLLIDILFDIPGVLGAAEAMREPTLSRYALIQQAFKLARWVRTLIFALEKWKEDHLCTHPAIYTTPNVEHLDLLALCELITGLPKYDAHLGEALNCYMAAHVILGRIAQRFTENSLLVRIALRPPYSLRDLVAGVVLVSTKHISDPTVGMVSMAVTMFPLKVAESTTEVDEPALFEMLRELLRRLNDHFISRYNIHYTVSSKPGAYEV